MRVVVMDREMTEPLTVVDIPNSLMRDVAMRGRPRITMAVPTDFNHWLSYADKFEDVMQTTTLQRCELRMEPIYRGRDVLYWVAVPDSEELALLLRAAFLPGQITELRRRELKQWIMGAIGAPRPEPA